MAVNKPVGDNARKGAVKKRSQLKTKLGGATAWTKRKQDVWRVHGGQFRTEDMMHWRERRDMPWIIAAFVIVFIGILVSGFTVGWR